MSLVVSILMSADGKAAKAEVISVRQEVAKTGKETEALGRKSRAGATGVRALGSAAAVAETQALSLAAAEAQAATGAIRLGRTNEMAAGSVGNLMAQFNDIGVMLMAGQNPLQMAVQQGTQITQVIGPMGAGGALSAMRQALVSMINPISLVTLGSIAAGAAMVNWLRSGGEEARTLEDDLSDLADAVERYSRAASGARTSGSELADEFGSSSIEARALLRNLAEIERANALDALSASAAKLSETFGGLSHTKMITAGGTDFISAAGGQMKEIEATYFALRKEFDLTENQAISLTRALKQIDMATSPEQSVVAARAFSDVLLEVFGTAADIPGPLREAARAALELAKSGGKIVSEDEARARLGAEAERTADEMLATLNEQATIQQLQAQFGEKSAIVENARLGYARAAYQVKVDELAVAQQLKDRLMAAFDAANQVKNPVTDWLADASKFAAARLEANIVDFRAAQDLKQTYTEQLAIQQAALIYGEDSVQAAEARWAAEERSLRTQLDGLNVSQNVRDAVIAAARATHDAEGAAAAWAGQMSGVRAEIDAIMSSLAARGHHGDHPHRAGQGRAPDGVAGGCHCRCGVAGSGLGGRADQDGRCPAARDRCRADDRADDRRHHADQCAHPRAHIRRADG